tara:strand:- start:7 stop:477 length:471 start_codon:yes stop_codon:yes gene_type:complete
MSVTRLALYISPKCRHCQALLQKINEDGLGDNFEIVDIHTVNVPSFIENVPTLLVDKGTKIEGRAIFMWMKNLKQTNEEVQAVEPDYNANPFTFINEGESERSNLQNFYELSNTSSNNAVHTEPSRSSVSTDRGTIDLDRLVQARKSDVPQPPKRI